MEKVSENRKADCPAAGRCGGCKGFAVSYKKRLEEKDRKIREFCKEFGTFAPVMGMEDTILYPAPMRKIPTVSCRWTAACWMMKKRMPLS